MIGAYKFYLSLCQCKAENQFFFIVILSMQSGESILFLVILSVAEGSSGAKKATENRKPNQKPKTEIRNRKKHDSPGGKVRIAKSR